MNIVILVIERRIFQLPVHSKALHTGGQFVRFYKVLDDKRLVQTVALSVCDRLFQFRWLFHLDDSTARTGIYGLDDDRPVEESDVFQCFFISGETLRMGYLEAVICQELAEQCLVVQDDSCLVWTMAVESQFFCHIGDGNHCPFHHRHYAVDLLFLCQLNQTVKVEYAHIVILISEGMCDIIGHIVDCQDIITEFVRLFNHRQQVQTATKKHQFLLHNRISSGKVRS